MSLAKMSNKMSTELNPRTTKLEFFGVPGMLSSRASGRFVYLFLGIGTTVLTLILPFIPYLLYFGCSEEMGGCTPNPMDLFQKLAHDLSTFDRVVARLWDPQAMVVFLGWLVYLVFCWAILPGDWVEGPVLRDGTRRVYKINGASSVFSSGLTSGLKGRLQPFKPCC